MHLVIKTMSLVVRWGPRWPAKSGEGVKSENADSGGPAQLAQ